MAIAEVHESGEIFTDIVQIPAVIVGGKPLAPLQEYSKLDISTLRVLADYYKGEIRYLKVRATFSLLEAPTELCGWKDCFRPVDSNGKGRCSDHVRKP